jgi:ketosteroid isomerase-like protein
MKKLYVTFRDLVIKIHASSEVSWLSCAFDWNFQAQGEQISTDGLRATWVLEKRNDKWKIVQLHFSFPKLDEK